MCCHRRVPNAPRRLPLSAQPSSDERVLPYTAGSNNEHEASGVKSPTTPKAERSLSEQKRSVHPSCASRPSLPPIPTSQPREAICRSIAAQATADAVATGSVGTTATVAMPEKLPQYAARANGVGRRTPLSKPTTLLAATGPRDA
eukprot:6210568-Pleurochrysis_carterae.AAC.1